LQHVLVLVAPDKRAYHAALMGFGTLVAAFGAGPPRVLAGWEAAEWTLDAIDDEGLALVEAVAEDAGADFAYLPAEGRRKRLLIADMDSTIIGCECLDELADFAGKKAEISAITERAMRGELDFEAALIERVGMLKGLSTQALASCFEERVRLNPGAETLVRTMQAHGGRAVLVSGGFGYFTKRVAVLAGFDAERANTLLVEDGALTGDVGRPILGRAAKLTALQEECTALGIGPHEALAIGDGANDLAMIEAAGLGVAYHAKRIVAARARAKIAFTGLTSALFFQGYARAEFAV
jgi:phosphoserine phosphatase